MFASFVVCSRLPVQATTQELLTPVYCNYEGGSSGFPEGAFCDFVTLQKKLCLHFGFSSAEGAPQGASIGGSFDNVASQPLKQVSFTVKDYKASAMQQLLIRSYLSTSKGVVFAYAYASEPTTKTTLANGDVSLTFKPSAFVTIPLNTPLTGATVNSMALDTIDSIDYPAVSYYVYNATLNSTALTPNTKQGGPFHNCTF